MRTTRTYQNCAKQTFRPEITTCPTCQTRLKRWATLSQRTIITLHGPVAVTHCGYRCPNAACATAPCIYRSAAADALALPGFTFGLDIVIQVGHLKLAQHQTLDEVHQALNATFHPYALSISRREVLYLFETYCAVLQACHLDHTSADFQAWLAQVKTNGGLIVSLDGIQPDFGNATIYLVRDVLTGRVLAAESVISSDTKTIVELLTPIALLGVPILGVISDAQTSIVAAVAQLWPTVPHQTCQFHYLREAARPIYDLDRTMRTKMRKAVNRASRDTRVQIARHLTALRQGDVTESVQQEITQWQVLDGYALAIDTALNFTGSLPFDYPGVRGYAALTDIATSLTCVEKKRLF